MGASGLMEAGGEKRNVVSAPPPPTATPATTAAAPAPPAQSRPAATQDATASSPKPAYPDAATRARINELLAKIEDAYFNYNEATLRPDATKTLNADSTELRAILKDYPDYKLRIEGNTA